MSDADAAWAEAPATDKGNHVLSSRRVVTGTGHGERSCVTADGAAPATGMEGYPGTEIARLWAADGGALDQSGTERDSTAAAFVQNGAVHGWRNTGPVRAVALFVMVGCQS